MSICYASDLAILENALEGLRVESGCAVTAQGTPDLTVAVAAGAVSIGGLDVTVAGGNSSAMTADATNPRWYLIEIDTAGAIQLNAGTAAASPIPPTPTAARVVVAAVYLPATAPSVDGTTSANGKGKIIDKRVLRTGLDIQKWTAAGTFTNAWVKPSGARWVKIILAGGGGGGGSGRCGAAGSVRGGGGGGQSGAYAVQEFAALAAGATATVIVGAGGAGGAAAGTAAADGAAGTAGGFSRFGTGIRADGGAAGAAGTATLGTGGTTAQTFGDYAGLNGASGGDGTTAAATTTKATIGATSKAGGGGGGGGGLPTGNTEQAGSAGAWGSVFESLAGSAGGTAGGVHAGGGNAVAPAAGVPEMGSGGGGGGSSSSTSVNAGDGGNGTNGGGGGGGGAGTSGGSAKGGKGGNGADGFLYAITIC